ncbi:hypothetical protein T07_10519 [Trichinella nelsoni]|uniref:Uncharacterized protein n=1 Tax=Trichinella nelsoni TaxID=6336 RepID=A0A0V0RYV1_9BILA|nr:hypothetical protein T07_10519 [Trichinella nelsoni]
MRRNTPWERRGCYDNNIASALADKNLTVVVDGQQKYCVGSVSEVHRALVSRTAARRITLRQEIN